MAKHVNMHAQGLNGDFKTKKALKDEIEADPYVVVFMPTSGYSDSTVIEAHDIPKDIILDVCGPNPFNNRKWYATVTRDTNGKAKVQ